MFLGKKLNVWQIDAIKEHLAKTEFIMPMQKKQNFNKKLLLLL